MADVIAKFSLNNRNINARFDLNEGNTVDAIFKIDAAGTTWGSIDGDIANQTDLYNILSAKANQSELDSLSETVSDNYTALESEINGLSSVVDNNYSETIERFENDELAVSNLTNTVSSNYTELNNKVLSNTTRITSISDTINSFGDIVTYNASNFATSAQGTLADTALQPNDNISKLVNNVGYITSASLPVVNNGTLTIRANGETVGTFNANQAEDTTVEISIPDSATWGNITGNIQNQTDLANALNGKQDNLTAQDGITLNNNIISGKPLEDAIGDIDELIPVQATAQNQLADKNFVNSSIATNTANFIGTFNSVAELEAYSGTLTNNDYAFVSTTDSAGNTLYDRYKWNGSQWLFEYELNNSSFTAAQWASINSGITSGDVSLISTAIQPNDNISELTNDVGYITSTSLPTVNNSNITLQKNGVDVGSFTLNQSSNSTINFSVPTDTSDLTNNAGFITSSSIPTVDQTFDGTSANAQSGIAINGVGFLQNTATGNSSITVNGTATTKSQAINIGTGSQATGNYGTALGAYSFGNASHALGIGNYAKATADYAIQLNKGTNSTSNSLYVGFDSDNYQLLDGATGLIPDARISTNIARTSQIPSAVTESTVSGWGFTKNVGTVTSVNNIQPDTNGNVTISIPDVSNFVTNSSLATTLGDYALLYNDVEFNSVNALLLTLDSSVTFSAETDSETGDKKLIIYAPIITIGTDDYYLDFTSNGVLINGNEVATQSWVTNQGYTTNVGTVTSVNNIQPDTNGNVTISTRNVGEVITSTLPLTDAGLHLLDGTLLQYGIYKEFIDYIADLYAENPTANYFTDETTWQASVTQYGSCGKFVYDSVSKTVRLPKVSDILQSTTDINALGDLIEAGLPNITGYTQREIKSSSTNVPTTEWYGAISYQTGDSGSYGGSGTQYRAAFLSFDASKSNPIYGNSTTVQPQTIKAFVYIVIANSTKTSIQVDIDLISADLNNKADCDLSNISTNANIANKNLTNITDTAKILISGMGMPSDSYIDLTLGASGSIYTAPANGYFCLNKIKISQNQYIAINRKSKDSDAFEMGVWSNGNPAATSGLVYTYLPAKKDDLIQIYYSAGGAVSYFRFIYAQGAESEFV